MSRYRLGSPDDSSVELPEYLASPRPLIWPKIVAMQFGLIALSLAAFMLEETLSELWPPSEQGPWSPMHALLPVSVTIMLLGVFCAVLLLPVLVAVTQDPSRLPFEWHTVGRLLLATCAPSLLAVICFEMDLYGVPARIADPICFIALLLIAVCFLFVAELTMAPMALVACVMIPCIISAFYVGGDSSDDPRVRYRRELEERDGSSVIDATTPASSTRRSIRLPAASGPTRDDLPPSSIRSQRLAQRSRDAVCPTYIVAHPSRSSQESS